MEKYLISDFSLSSDTDGGIRSFLSDPGNARYAREPVIAKMKNGTLCYACLSGGALEPANGNRIIYKKSYDSGKTWSDGEVIFPHRSRGVWCTEICTLFDVPIMVISIYDGNCPYKMLQTFLSYSYDCGETWTSPVMADAAISTASVRFGIKMSNGEVLFPVYYTLSDSVFDYDPEKKSSEPDFWDGVHHECAAVITRDGKNFFRSGKIALGKNMLWEPNAVEVSPGHIVMLIRYEKSGVLGISESFDYGRTWSLPKSSGIENPGSKIALFRVGEKIGLVSNYNPKDRKNLEIRITSDGFSSWDSITEVDDADKLFFYPHVLVCEEDETLYVAYENCRQHYLKKFSFDELNI